MPFLSECYNGEPTASYLTGKGSRNPHVVQRHNRVGPRGHSHHLGSEGKEVGELTTEAQPVTESPPTEHSKALLRAKGQQLLLGLPNNFILEKINAFQEVLNDD